MSQYEHVSSRYRNGTSSSEAGSTQLLMNTPRSYNKETPVTTRSISATTPRSSSKLGMRISTNSSKNGTQNSLSKVVTSSGYGKDTKRRPTRTHVLSMTPATSSPFATPKSQIKGNIHLHSSVIDSPPDFPGKSTGDLLSTLKDSLPKGEVRCMCTVGNYIWTGGTFGQMGIYSNNNSYENIETKTIWRPTDSFSVLATISVGNEKDVHTIDNKIWSGFHSGKVAVWNFETMKKEHEISGHHDAVTSIIQAGDKVWSSSMDGTIRIWDSQTLQPLNKHDDHKCPVRCMALIPSLKEVWTAGDDGVIIIRDADTGEPRTGIEMTDNIATLFLVVVSNGNVWSGHRDGKLRVWDSTERVCLKEIQAHTSEPTHLISTSKQVWSCSSDKLIRIFDSDSMKELKKIRAVTVWVLSMLCLTKERVFAVCSDKKIRVWKCEGEQLTLKLPKPASAVKKHEVTPGQKKLSSSFTHSRAHSVDNSLMRSLEMSEEAFDLLNGVVEFPDNEPVNTIDLPLHSQLTRLHHVPSPMVSPILTQQQLKQRYAPPLERKVSQSQGILLSPEFSVPHAPDNSYDSSDDDDDDEDVHTAMREAFEKEIVILRQQLQEATSRIGKYRSKLRTRRAKLHEKETENKGVQMKYNIMQEELYSLRGEMVELHQQLSEKDASIDQLHGERKQIMTRLLSIYSTVSSGKDIADEHDSSKEVSIRALEKVALQIEMDVQLIRFNSIQHSISTEDVSGSSLDEVLKENRKLKEKLTELKPVVDLCKDDIRNLLDEIKILEERNKQLSNSIQGTREEQQHLTMTRSDSDQISTQNHDLVNLLALTEQSMLSVLEDVNDLRNVIEQEHSSASLSLQNNSLQQDFSFCDETVLGNTTRDLEVSADTEQQIISDWVDGIVKKMKDVYGEC